MEGDRELDIQQRLESAALDTSFDWKIEGGLEAPVNAFSAILLEDLNWRTPALYEVLNQAPALLTEEDLAAGAEVREARWPEEVNVVARENLPSSAEQYVLLHKVPL